MTALMLSVTPAAPPVTDGDSLLQQFNHAATQEQLTAPACFLTGLTPGVSPGSAAQHAAMSSPSHLPSMGRLCCCPHTSFLFCPAQEGHSRAGCLLTWQCFSSHLEMAGCFLPTVPREELNLSLHSLRTSDNCSPKSSEVHGSSHHFRFLWYISPKGAYLTNTINECTQRQ